VSNGIFNDTWEFHGGAWSQISTPFTPPPLEGAAMATDPSGGGVIVYGGGSDSPSHDGSWTSTSTYRFNETTWTNVSPAGGPSPLVGGVLTADPALGGAVYFGGTRSNGTDPHSTPWSSNATWEWTGSSWTNLSLAAGPSPRVGPSFAYDPAGGYALLFGGQVAIGRQALLNDTWVLNATGGSAPLYPLWFNETDLPAASNWSVELSGMSAGLTIEASSALTKWSDGAMTIKFLVSAGTYAYTSGLGGYRPTSGNLTVGAGAPQTVALEFVPQSSSGPPPSVLGLPEGAVVVGAVILLIGAIGLTGTMYRIRSRERQKGRVLATQLLENDWGPDAKGEPVPWRGR
jgi:hypothetical protein